MNNKQIVTVLTVIILASVGFFAYTNYQTYKKDYVMMQETGRDWGTKDVRDNKAMEKTNDSLTKDDSQTMKADSRYKPYSKAVLDGTAQTRRVLFFYASWCPTCRPADAEFSEKSAQIPEDVTLIRVNYNDPDTDAEEKALAQQYGVTYQHTYVQIDAAGKEVVKWNGGQLAELLTKIK